MLLTCCQRVANVDSRKGPWEMMRVLRMPPRASVSKNPKNPLPNLSTPSHLLSPSAPSASGPLAPPPPLGAEEEEDALRVVLEALPALVRGGWSLEARMWSARQGAQGSQARNSPGM